MKLDEIVDDRHLIANDARHNKGKHIKSIVQSSKRKSNSDTTTSQFVADGPGDTGEVQTQE